MIISFTIFFIIFKVHFEVDMLGENKCDLGMTERYSEKTMILAYLLFFGSLFGICYLTKDITVFQPVVSYN